MTLSPDVARTRRRISFAMRDSGSTRSASPARATVARHSPDNRGGFVLEPESVRRLRGQLATRMPSWPIPVRMTVKELGPKALPPSGGARRRPAGKSFRADPGAVQALLSAVGDDDHVEVARGDPSFSGVQERPRGRFLHRDRTLGGQPFGQEPREHGRHVLDDDDRHWEIGRQRRRISARALGPPVDVPIASTSTRPEVMRAGGDAAGAPMVDGRATMLARPAAGHRVADTGRRGP